MPYKFTLRENNLANAAMDVMAYNDQFQDSPMIGCFWYDAENDELFGVGSEFASGREFYYSTDFNTYVKTGQKLHKQIWQKEFHKGKDKRFQGDYTKIPRGRVFEFKDQGFKVFTGSWIKDYPEVELQIVDEFQLPIHNTEFLIDTHWDIGHGWSNDFL